MFKFSRRRGFTLIELLVVISIIAMLSSIVLVALQSARAKGRDAKRQSDIHQIQIALESYYQSNSSYPGVSWYDSNDVTWATLNTLLSAYKSGPLPTDPTQTASGRAYSVNTYAYSYIPCTGGQQYMLLWRSESKAVPSPGIKCAGPAPFNTNSPVGAANFSYPQAAAYDGAVSVGSPVRNPTVSY